MSISDKKLPFSGNAILLEKIATNYTKFADSNAKEIPGQQIYKVVCEEESPKVERSARKCALESINNSIGFTKLAIDSRRIDQEMDRNPRPTIQYFRRADQFIDNGMQNDINIFSKLMIPLMEIKGSYGDQPEYFESYSRILFENVERILRVKQADQDFHRAQFEYLKQLLFARYRLSMEEVSQLSVMELKARILNKDENLIKRGLFLQNTGESSVAKRAAIPVKNGIEPTTQEAIVNAIFGSSDSDLRKPGERTSTKTITITIKNEFD